VIATDSQIQAANFGTAEIREIFSDRAWMQHMLDFEAALARVEARLGIIPSSAVQAIASAARVENLDVVAIMRSTQLVGYPVVELTRQLAARAGADAARYVHLGATTQDVLDTATVLQIRAAMAIVRRDVIVIAKSLAHRARQYRDTPMAGRTHLQHAVPITFGYKCAIWAEPLVAHVDRIDQAMARVAVVQFGGAAGTLASLGEKGVEVMEALAHELDLGAPTTPWHVSRAAFAEIASVLSMVCGSIGKIANDVILLSQSEIGEVAEEHEESRGSSSTMPQKRNPIASEFVLAAVRGVHALAPMMFAAMIPEHERSTSSWQSEPLAFPQMFVLAAGALERTISIVDNMVPDAQRMRRNLESNHGLIMAEALATRLTAALGRAGAHGIVERVCGLAIEQGRALADVARENREVRAHLSEAEITQALDPTSYTGSSGALVDRVCARVDAMR